jgi:hypothetical protein
MRSVPPIVLVRCCLKKKSEFQILCIWIIFVYGFIIFVTLLYIEKYTHGGKIWGKNNYPNEKGAAFGFSLTNPSEKSES